jgi:hypothetical protein
MRRLFTSIWVVAAVLLLSLHAAGAPPAGSGSALPNAVSYVPFVARNWLPSAEPTPTPTLEPASISGRVVVAANGAPLAGATVEAYDAKERGGPVVSATTDVTGHYSFGPMAPGDYYVLAYADGYARVIYIQAAVIQEALLVAYAGQPVTGIDFALAQGGSLSGRVTEADGVTPISGIQVEATQAKYGYVDNLWFAATSGEDGHYRVAHLPLGEYLVAVEADGYVNEFYDGVNYLSLYTAVAVQPPQEMADIDLALDPEGQLSGWVIDEQTSAPVAGALVHMLPTGPGTAPTWGMAMECDAMGAFTVGRLPPADFLVSVRAEGYADEIYDHQPGWSHANMVEIPHGGHVTDLTVRMRRGGLIRGHLYNEAMEPLPGFWLTVQLPDGDLAGAVPAGTRLDGSFSICMPPGTYIVMADQVPGYVQEYYDSVYRAEDATHIEITEGGEVSGIDFTVQLAGSISGAVYRSDGATPVPDAQVYAFPLSATVGDGAITQADGRYTIEGVPSGSYRIEVSVPGSEMVVYYPGVTEVGAAQPVQVNAPLETSGIDILVPEP